MKKCPYCMEQIQDEAIKCRYCGSLLAKITKDKWYFKPITLITAFLCVGPLMLPLVWFNPRLSPKAKVIISILIVIVSYFVGSLLLNSLKSISEYYKIILS